MQFRQDRSQDKKVIRLWKVLARKPIFSTSAKHGRTDGPTLFLRRCSTTLTPLESAQLVELKYAISAGWDVRKNTAFDRANLDENVPRSPKVKYVGLGFSSTQFHEPYAVEKLSIS